jgi:hypothetical protein
LNAYSNVKAVFKLPAIAALKRWQAGCLLLCASKEVKEKKY